MVCKQRFDHKKLCLVSIVTREQDIKKDKAFLCMQAKHEKSQKIAEESISQ